MPGSTNWPGALDVFTPKKVVDLEAAIQAMQAQLRGGQGPHFNVVNYGAVPNGGAGSAKAGVLAAINAAIAVSGVVYFPPGVWDVGDLAIVLPDWNAARRSVTLRGAGCWASTLKFSTDRGAGTYGIAGAGTPGLANAFNIIEDLGILGPGNQGCAIGTSPCAMDGIQLGTQMKIHRSVAGGWRSGIVSVGNHCSVRDVEVSGCYYAFYFKVNYNYAGDIVIDNCKLSGNKFASIAVSDGSLVAFQMNRGHLGFSPYAVYFEASTSTGLYMGGTQFVGTSWEALGNGAIYSEGQTARIQGLELFQCGNFSRVSTYGIASRTDNPSIYVKDFTDVRFVDGTPINHGTDGACMDVSGYLGVTIEGDWQTSLTQSINGARPWVLAGSSQPVLKLLSSGSGGGAVKAFGAFRDTVSNDAILVGSVLEYNDGVLTNTIRLWGHYSGGRTQLAGVALNAVPAGSDARTMVVVITQSAAATVLFDGAAASAYLAVGSVTTAGKATGILYDGTNTSTTGRPIIGGAYAGAFPIAAGSATVRVDIR